MGNWILIILGTVGLLGMALWVVRDWLEEPYH
jgi:hypothetical protein